MAALVVVAAAASTGCSLLFEEPPDWPERLAEAEATLGKTPAVPEDHFYALTDGAKAAYEVGDLDKAERFARQLLAMAPTFPKDWNYGNAIHDGNMVLGRLALRRGDMAGATQHLTAAGNTPGSPQLNSFGPNMALASDLLQVDQRPAVLSYFGQCRRFWEMGDRDLRQWEALVKDGQRPDFGAHLLY